MHHAMTARLSPFDESDLGRAETALVLLESDEYEPAPIEALRKSYMDFSGSLKELTDKEIVKYARMEVKDYYRNTRSFSLRFKRGLRRDNDFIRRVAAEENDPNVDKIFPELAKLLLKIDGRTP